MELVLHMILKLVYVASQYMFYFINSVTISGYII